MKEILTKEILEQTKAFPARILLASKLNKVYTTLWIASTLSHDGSLSSYFEIKRGSHSTVASSLETILEDYNKD